MFFVIKSFVFSSYLSLPSLRSLYPLQADIASLRYELKELHNRCSDLAAENEALQQNLQSVNDELVAAKTTAERSLQERQRFKNHTDAMQAELAAKTRTIEDLVRKRTYSHTHLRVTLNMCSENSLTLEILVIIVPLLSFL